MITVFNNVAALFSELSQTVTENHIESHFVTDYHKVHIYHKVHKRFWNSSMKEESRVDRTLPHIKKFEIQF